MDLNSGPTHYKVQRYIKLLGYAGSLPKWVTAGFLSSLNSNSKLLFLTSKI